MYAMREGTDAPSENAHPRTLFPAERPLKSALIYIHGGLHKSKRGFVGIVRMADRFTKLKQIVPLHRINMYDVVLAFTGHWELHTGAPHTQVYS